MRSSEFIIVNNLVEDWGDEVVCELLLEAKPGIPFISRNGVILKLTQHYFDRLTGASPREGHAILTPEVAEPFLYKLGKVRKHMAKYDEGTQFWVIDHESGISFGLRRQYDDPKTGSQVNVVGTVITPYADGRPSHPNGNLNPIIHMA